MRVLVDTNILISAALSSNGTPYKAFLKRRSLLEHFLSIALLAMEVVPTPIEEAEEESCIRDVADRPILRAAINAKVDVLLTGDKDFLESGVTYPQIMTAAEFIK